MPIKAYGTILAFGNQSTYAASTTWTDVANVTELEPPSIEADDIDTTHLLSADEHREWLPGWADSGELTFQIHYDHTQSTAIHALFREPKGWRITFTDGTKFGVSGYIKGMGTEIDFEGIVQNTITVKCTGPAVFQPAS